MTDPHPRETPTASVTSTEADGTLVLEISGVFDFLAIGSVQTRVEGEIQPQIAAVIVDLSGVTFLDSSAIGLLFGLSSRLRRRRRRCAVVVPGEHPIHSLLVLAGLDAVTVLADTVSDATVQLSAQP